MKDLSASKKRLYLSIVITSLGVVLNTTLDSGATGTVMIAIGGLLLISAFAKKKEEETSQKEK
jgi:hypothetical protein